MSAILAAERWADRKPGRHWALGYGGNKAVRMSKVLISGFGVVITRRLLRVGLVSCSF